MSQPAQQVGPPAILSSRVQKPDVMFADGANMDAFARLRVSNPTTIFDSKQLFDNAPFFWDDAETSGSGTSSTYNTNKSSTTIAVANTTAGTRVRQTFQRFNYQPGKSQLIVMTGRIGGGEPGIEQRIGQFDDENGLMFSVIDGTLGVTRRSYTSGGVVNTTTAQSDWNKDTMDGTGPSGVTLDLSLTQIFFIDYEWLGVGRVRFGFFIDGIPVVCHELYNTNDITQVYMTTPNLPLRYEISNDGTGGASVLDHICSTVISEGGQNNIGILRHDDSGSVSSLSTGTLYATMGIRLKSTHFDQSVLIENISMISTTQNDQVHWELLFNPTVAGTFTYSDVTNSGVQIAKGTSSNTVTGGTAIDGGYLSTALPVQNTVPNALKLGAAIDGTVDEIVLCAKPITNNITVQSSMTWRELS